MRIGLTESRVQVSYKYFCHYTLVSFKVWCILYSVYRTSALVV
jgi:hypothetical protein